MRERIMIVDDHAAYRNALRQLLAADGFAVVAEADGGAEALRLAAETQPSIVLLDIQLPDLDGFEVARQMAAWDQPPTVILISSRDADEYGGQVETATCRGFLSKGRLTGAAIRGLAG